VNLLDLLLWVKLDLEQEWREGQGAGGFSISNTIRAQPTPLFSTNIIDVITPQIHCHSNHSDVSLSQKEDIKGSPTSTNEGEVGKVCEICRMKESIEQFAFGEVDRWLCVDCLVRAKEMSVEMENIKR
jgi:hypothetical protein